MALGDQMSRSRAGMLVASLPYDALNIELSALAGIELASPELYLGARLYSYEEEVSSFDDGFAVLSGARLRF